MPSSRQPDGAFVSPTGHWLIFSTNNTANWFILDTQTGQERPLGYDPYEDIRWLNKEEFAAGWRVVEAKDLSILALEAFDTPENDLEALEILRGAKRVYLLPERGTGGVAVLSGDPAYPYGFDAFEVLPDKPVQGVGYGYMPNMLHEQFPETEFVVVEGQYFQPTPGTRQPSIKGTATRFYVNYDFPSLDGRFYARSPGGAKLIIYQCGQKLVAQAEKDNWYIYPKGWAYDNSGFYFFLQPKVGWFTAGDISLSILKLNLPPDVLANAPPYKGEGFCE